MRHNGFILFLGTNFRANTCIHALEIEARVPGLLTERSTTLHVIDQGGKSMSVQHHWHAPKKAFYTDLEHIVQAAGGLTYGRIGSGISRLVDAHISRNVLLPLFRTTPELGFIPLTDSQFVWE